MFKSSSSLLVILLAASGFASGHEKQRDAGSTPLEGNAVSSSQTTESTDKNNSSGNTGSSANQRGAQQIANNKEQEPKAQRSRPLQGVKGSTQPHNKTTAQGSLQKSTPGSESSGASVISTDSLPVGSSTATPVGSGKTVSESQYPTTQGSGGMGSGSASSPTGPVPGPTNGLGR